MPGVWSKHQKEQVWLTLWRKIKCSFKDLVWFSGSLFSCPAQKPGRSLQLFIIVSYRRHQMLLQWLSPLVCHRGLSVKLLCPTHVSYMCWKESTNQNIVFHTEAEKMNENCVGDVSNLSHLPWNQYILKYPKILVVFSQVSRKDFEGFKNLYHRFLQVKGPSVEWLKIQRPPDESVSVSVESLDHWIHVQQELVFVFTWLLYMFLQVMSFLPQYSSLHRSQTCHSLSAGLAN